MEKKTNGEKEKQKKKKRGKSEIVCSILVVMLLVLSSNTDAANKDKEKDRDKDNKKQVTEFIVKTAFCSQKLEDIDEAAGDIKSSEFGRGSFLRDSVKAHEEKNYSKVQELNKLIKEYDDEIAARTHLLADIVSIYHVSGCDMVEAMRHMYCPNGWSKGCEWVYGKPDKDKVPRGRVERTQ